MLNADDEDDVVAVVLKEPDHDGALAIALDAGHSFADVEGGTYPADSDRVGDPDGQGFDFIDLSPGEAVGDGGGVRDVFPRPVAHAVAVSACRRISLISAAAARRSARSADSATTRSQERSRAARRGHRCTATQLNQCSTKYRAGSRLYSSRARAVAAVQSASNRASAAGSRRATA